MNPISSSIRLIFPLWLCLAFGCTSVNQMIVTNTYTGVKAAMNAPTPRTLCVVFVHGIGGYSDGDPQALIDAFQKQMNLKQIKGDTTLPMPAESGNLNVQVFQGSNGRQLRAYTILWEPVSQKMKTKFLAYDSSPDVAQYRLKLDDTLKQEFIDDRAADVVLYCGTYGTTIRKCIRTALSEIQNDAGAVSNKDAECRYIFVSWSIGSKIVFDCLDDEITAADKDAQANADFWKIRDQTDSIFMLANQLSLLALAKAGGDEASSSARTGYESMASFAKARQKTRGDAPLSIVAISDPNDLLSYEISPWAKEHLQINALTFTDVLINVAGKVWWIPFVSGGDTIVNPLTAHTGYGSNEDVQKRIIEGGSPKDSRK